MEYRASSEPRLFHLDVGRSDTLPHFSASSAINLPKSEEESASTLPPEFTSCAFILGSARPALISLLSLSMISAGVSFGAPMPCHALAAIADDPHLAAVKLVERAVHPTEGPVRSVRPTLVIDGEVVRSQSLARALGSDTRKVLAEAGYSDAEIDGLVRSGAAIDGHA